MALLSRGCRNRLTTTPTDRARISSLVLGRPGERDRRRYLIRRGWSVEAAEAREDVDRGLDHLTHRASYGLRCRTEASLSPIVSAVARDASQPGCVKPANAFREKGVITRL